jgi:hypothetical protein
MSNVDFSQIEPCLTEGTLLALKSFGFTRMTPVQAATIPLFLTNKVRYEYYDTRGFCSELDTHETVTTFARRLYLYLL